VKALHPTGHKIGYFRGIRLSQSLETVLCPVVALTKENPIQQKQGHKIQIYLS